MISVSEMRELDWFQDPNRRNMVLRKDASWRKMFPVQPPASIDKVVQGEECDGYYLLQHGVITSQFQSIQAQGARMGLIYDILIRELVDNPAASIYML
jgi:hypothetical protein